MGIGDWVKLNYSVFRVGVIDKIDESDKTVCVHWLKEGKIGVSSVGWYKPDALEVIPVKLNADDYIAMAHIALETDDKQWFDELLTNVNNLEESGDKIGEN